MVPSEVDPRTLLWPRDAVLYHGASIQAIREAPYNVASPLLYHWQFVWFVSKKLLLSLYEI